MWKYRKNKFYIYPFFVVVLKERCRKNTCWCWNGMFFPMPYFLCNLKSVKYCVPFLMSGHFPLEWHCRKNLIAGVATQPIQSLAINIYRPFPCIVAPCKQQKITPQALCCAPDSHTHIITIIALFFSDAVLHIITCSALWWYLRKCGTKNQQAMQTVNVF